MCSLASLLFLRFGLLPLFTPPERPSPKKRKRKQQKSLPKSSKGSQLCKFFSKMIPFRQKSGSGPSTAAKGCRVSPLALSDGSGKLVNMKTELDYQRSSNTWSWHSNKTKQSSQSEQFNKSGQSSQSEQFNKSGQFNQSEQFNKSEQHTDSNGVEPELVVVEQPPLRDLHWTLGSATEEESDDEAVKRARAAVMMTATAAATGDGGYCSSTMAEMSSGGEEENSSRAFRPAKEEEQQQPREETQKQQQQQQENLPPKKWKKSFKICKCIPSKEEDQIIKLPATLVDLPPRPLIMSSNSGSRFRIIPVENRYKRGRWDCWDYYEGAEIQKKAFLQQQNFGPTAEAGRWLPSSSPSSPEKTLTTPSSQPLIHQQPPQQQQQTHNQQIPQPLPPPMPRRNSFQLVTICRGLDDRRCSSSVPTSISEEKLNVLGEQQQQQQPQQQSSVPPSLLPTRAPSRSRTPPPPQIVEPSTQSTTTQIDFEVADRLRTMTTVTVNGIASSPNSSSNLIVPAANIAAVVAANAVTVSSPSHMIQQFGLERSLTLGLAQGNDQQQPQQQKPAAAVQNGTTASHQAQQPQPQQQQFSASFGPGQIQFGHNQQANRLQSPEERRTAALRRSSSASTGGTPASVAAAQQRVDAGVAIDSKIEQAMDLVKTHLIYAVRDEIELLRSRIVQLETTVVQLERENAQLREFVPHEVLASLCLLDQQGVGQPQPNLLLNKVPSSPAGFAKAVPAAAAAAAAAIVQ